MAPEMADVIEDLVDAGTLRITTPDQVDVSRFSRVINCSGPAPVCTRGWNAVVDRLAARGLLRPNDLALGLDVDADGLLVDVSGQATPGLYAMGAARRGHAWEVAAIPDIRRQASPSPQSSPMAWRMEIASSSQAIASSVRSVRYSTWAPCSSNAARWASTIPRRGRSASWNCATASR